MHTRISQAAAGGVLAALSALGCSHAVAVRPAPSYEALAFEAALPVEAAVFVDGEQLVRNVRLTPVPSGSICEGNQYPVDARDAFRASVVGTLERVVERVEPTEAPLARQDMEARGLGAVFLVRADSFGVAVDAGLFRGFEAEAQLTLLVTAFTHEGRMLRELVYGTAVETEGGHGCGNGAVVVGAAVEEAIRNAMTEMGELLANAPNLRASLGLARAR